MERKNFIKLTLGGIAVASLQPLYSWSKNLKENDQKLPVLFIGHGSPMNGIEDNEFSRTWTKFGKENTKTIHDFGGFPHFFFNV